MKFQVSLNLRKEDEYLSWGKLTLTKSLIAIIDTSNCLDAASIRAAITANGLRVVVRVRVFLLSPLLSRVCRMLGIAVLLLDNVRTKKVKKEWTIARPILVGHYLRRALYFIAWQIISNPLVSVQTAYDPDSSSWAISVLNSYVCINKNKSSNCVTKKPKRQVNVLN